MIIWIGKNQIEFVQGDITDQSVDAIVNAANSALAGGGGVDGAIHRKGGSTIMKETNDKFPDGCPTGSAVVTSAGKLDAQHVLHAVGPIWRGGDHHEAALLAAAYETCLNLATQYECESIAFPSLSTGAYNFPIRQASRIAVQSVFSYLAKHQNPSTVRFVLFDAATLQIFTATAQEQDGVK